MGARLGNPRDLAVADLLQRVESTPDTILTLIDGTKYIVAESMSQITDLVVEYRARVVAATMSLAHDQADERRAEQVAAVTELRSVSRPLSSVPDGD